MTSEDITKLEAFEEKLYRLKLKHEQYVKRNKELEKTLVERDTLLKDLQQRYISLEQKYNNLKQAKVISLSDAEIGVTRERVTRLVREIDQCIESLTK
ncbi:MAG: hypothetical protein IKD40_05325 [Bacteroidaceae bacterium]|nr:hypothetical protein [Bacteroidaceae bacterium]